MRIGTAKVNYTPVAHLCAGAVPSKYCTQDTCSSCIVSSSLLLNPPSGRPHCTELGHQHTGRIGTAEVESALVAHASVSEAAVVGFPEPVKGQGLCCYVTLKEKVVASDGLIADLRLQVGVLHMTCHEQLTSDHSGKYAGMCTHRETALHSKHTHIAVKPVFKDEFLRAMA